MTGWPVAWACFLAWRFAESSQHSVVPHSWHVHRWIHVAPVFTHSAHSRRFGGLTDVIASMCAQCPSDIIRSLLLHHVMDERDAIESSRTAEVRRFDPRTYGRPPARTPRRKQALVTSVSTAATWEDDSNLFTICDPHAGCVARLNARFASPPTTPRAIANAFSAGVHSDTSPQIASREYAPGPVKVSAADADA
jgi:hypothetical protein